MVIKREPNPDKVDCTPNCTPWTGFGFMQVFEGSTLTFLIPNIFRTLNYDLVVRHEHTDKFPNKWNKATFELISLDGPASVDCQPWLGTPDAVEVTTKEIEEVTTEEIVESSGEGESTTEGSPVGESSIEGTGGGDGRRKRALDENGSGEISPNNGVTTITTGEFSMSPETKHTIITPSLCLEKGKRYEIKFTFDQYDLATPDSKATINIDAVSLYLNLEKSFA